jgi:hypothetical protein
MSRPCVTVSGNYPFAKKRRSGVLRRIKFAQLALSTLAAERQVRDFLIGPRNKKQRKKGRPLKFFIHRSKLQAGTSDDDGHRESELIGVVTRPRPTSACSGGGAAGGGGDTHRHLCAEFPLKCLLVIWNGG